MTEREAIAYIEQWDVTEAAKVLKWYEDNELLRPCDCDMMIAIETESLRDENAKLRELADSSYTFAFNCYHGVFDQEAFFRLREKYHDSGIEVD